MALSNVELLKLTNSPLIQGVLENIVTSDQSSRTSPWWASAARAWTSTARRRCP